MIYKVREQADGRFGIYQIAPNGNEIRVKVFKTRKAAENWISKR